MSLREQLIASGLVRERCEAVKVILARIRRDADRQIQNALNTIGLIDRRERFVADLRPNMTHKRHDGGTSYEARMRSAAGADSRVKYRLNPPATKFGETTSKPHPKDHKGNPVTPSGKICTRHHHEPG